MNPRVDLLAELITVALDTNGVGGCEHGVTAGCIHCRARWSAEAVDAWLRLKNLPEDVAEVSTRDEREMDYAYVDDVRVATERGRVRYVFNRLVRAGTTKPDDTLNAEDAMVDVDADGRVIGMTVVLHDWTPVEPAGNPD